MVNEVKLNHALCDAQVEMRRATELHGKFNSAHEGFAVLYEEVDELWEEVRKKRALRDPSKLRGECIQIAAMALRFIHDLT